MLLTTSQKSIWQITQMSELVPYRRRKVFGHGESATTEPTVEAENSAWDYYNDKAKIEDIELVTDWYETLSNLLIFVSLTRLDKFY